MFSGEMEFVLPNGFILESKSEYSIQIIIDDRKKTKKKNSHLPFDEVHSFQSDDPPVFVLGMSDLRLVFGQHR